MPTKHSPALISAIVGAYHSGTPVSTLCATHDVPRSTIYSWLTQQRKLKSTAGTEFCLKDYKDLKRHNDKLETQLIILKLSGCGLSAPLKEKLAALEKLYGQYNVHSLCDAFDVSRGTFYNHIFRKKDVTAYDKRRAELSIHVRDVFDEFKQRLGAKRIAVVLTERGIKVSDKYVSSIMRELGLESIGRHSKKEYKKLAARGKPNILQREFNVLEPNRVWVSDVTCFKVEGKYIYTCVIIDLFSRKVVAHKISRSNSTYLITTTFRQAFKSRNQPHGTISYKTPEQFETLYFASNPS